MRVEVGREHGRWCIPEARKHPGRHQTPSRSCWKRRKLGIGEFARAHRGVDGVAPAEAEGEESEASRHSEAELGQAGS